MKKHRMKYKQAVTKKRVAKKTKDDTWVSIVVLKEEIRSSFAKIGAGLKALASAIEQIQTDAKKSQTFLEQAIHHQSEAISRLQLWYERRVASDAEAHFESLCNMKTFTHNGVTFVRQNPAKKSTKGGQHGTRSRS